MAAKPDDLSSVALSLRGIRKSFANSGQPSPVLDGFDLEVRTGEFVSIFGPNGSGKTTLLHLIAGILPPDGGTVSHVGHGHAQSVGMVFQNYEKSLLPWRTCLNNIALPLEASTQLSEAERRTHVRALLETLGLDLPLDRYPYEMSGGQKQLSSIARAMIASPSLLLLDEPFASLDYQTRLSMHTLLEGICKRTGVTTVFISHEIDEALILADRLLLLTARPARVAASFEVHLPRPRGLALTSLPAYVGLRAEVLRHFTQIAR